LSGYTIALKTGETDKAIQAKAAMTFCRYKLTEMFGKIFDRQPKKLSQNHSI